MKVIPIVLLLFLAGCSSTVPIRPALQDTDPGRIHVPPEDQKPCPPLPPPPPGPLSEEAAGLLYVDWADKYYTCSSRKDRIFRAIELLNEKS